MKGIAIGLGLVLGVVAMLGAQGNGEPAASVPERTDERLRLVERHIAGAGITDPETLEAMRRVPRHEFVPEEQRRLAYRNQPLPIGHGQTISQPYIVAYMTEALDLEASDRVLEIGAGSGYQAAVLAEIVDQVFTIEIIEPLATSARERFRRLGYDNVTVMQGDGYYGWSEHGPYDAIIVTAAAGHIPRPLLEQLKPRGKLVIPIGPVYAVQTLVIAGFDGDGRVRTQQLLPVRFVPMTGKVQE